MDLAGSAQALRVEGYTHFEAGITLYMYDGACEVKLTGNLYIVYGVCVGLYVGLQGQMARPSI